MNIAAGSDIAKALAKCKDGEALTLAPGRYEPFTVMNRKLATKIVGFGAIIEGGDNCARFDSCGLVTLVGLQLVKPTTYGLFLTRCGGLQAERVVAQDAGKTGFLTGRTSNVTFYHCIASGSKAEHGYYVSEGGDHISFVSCESSNNHRSGFQVNANGGPSGISNVVRFERCLARGNQHAGAGAYQLAGCHGVVMLNNRTEEHYGLLRVLR
jgi:hypothetical protein